MSWLRSRTDSTALNGVHQQRASQTILAAKSWVNNRVISELTEEMRRKCEAETVEPSCIAVARIGNRAACTWTEGGTPPCALTEIPESSINQWLEWTMFALFGLAFGQLIRLLSSHIFRRATKDQVCLFVCVCVCVCVCFALFPSPTRFLIEN